MWCEVIKRMIESSFSSCHNQEDGAESEKSASWYFHFNGGVAVVTDHVSHDAFAFSEGFDD